MDKIATEQQYVTRGNKIAWLLVPYMALSQALQVAYPVPGFEMFTFEFFTLFGAAALTYPWWSRRWMELGRPALTMIVAFAALIFYAFVSLIVHPQPFVFLHETYISRSFVAMPLATAAFSMIAGFGFVLAAQKHLRLRILATAGLASVIIAFIGWPFQSAYRDYARLATSQGGAAIIHVVFLLIAAIGLASFLRKRRGAASLTVTILAVIALFATQSRAGFLTLIAWIGLIALGTLVAKPENMRRLWPLGVAAGVGLVALPFIPGASRLLELFDSRRAENAYTALEWWSRDSASMLFGTGPGHVWPWYAYESGAYEMPGGAYYEMAPTPYGDVLLTPHSTPVAMLVELGVPGGIVAFLFAAALVRMWATSRMSLSQLVLTSALLACLVAFSVDTYLIRNFGVTLWWWAAVALVSSTTHADTSDAALLRGQAIDSIRPTPAAAH